MGFRGMQDAGCWMQDAGCGMWDARCRMRDAGCLASRILHPLDSDFLQCLLEIGNNVFDFFNTHREPHELIRDTSLLTSFG